LNPRRPVLPHRAGGWGNLRHPGRRHRSVGRRDADLLGVIAGKVMLILHAGQSAIGAESAGWGVIVVGIAAGIGAGLAWGVLNGLLTAKAKMPPFIVTLGTLGMATGGSYLLTGGTDLRGIPTRFTSLIGFGRLFGQ